MALNWSGQNSGMSQGPNLSNLYQQNQQPQGMSQGWRPSTTGATGISGIGGNQIGLSRPQMSPAPPMYPQMSSAYPTSKGGTPLYNRDAIQQGQDWVNQNTPQQQQLPPGATGQDGLGNPTYPQMHDNNPSGGGGQGGLPGRDDAGSGPTYGGVGMTPGPAGHQGAQQDYYDPVTGQMIYGNQQATGWQASYSGMNSGEGGMTSGVGGGGGYGMPFTQAQYMAMKPEQQAAANNWMATQMPYMQFGYNAYTNDRDFNQAAGQWGLTYAQQVANDAWNQTFAQQQYAGQREDTALAQQNWQTQRADENKWNDRNMTLQEQNAIRQQQQWGAGHVLQQQQQGHQQGMDIKGLQLSQLKEEHDYYVATGQLDLARKTQEQAYGIQQGRLGLDTVVAQNQNEQFRLDQANQMTRFGQTFGLEQELGRGNLALQQNRFGLEDYLGRGNLALEQELGRGNLSLQQNRFGLESELGRGNLALEQELGRGGLALQQQRFGQDQYEFGAQMDFEKQKNQQQYGLAVGDQELDYYIQTGQLDLARQQFGQGQYEFDAAQRQQMAIEQMRLAQQERAANVAATGRALAPNARWLRQS
jgi:hypothetical protein